jgi:hypothetical protein
MNRCNGSGVFAGARSFDAPASRATACAAVTATSIAAASFSFDTGFAR